MVAEGDISSAENMHRIERGHHVRPALDMPLALFPNGKL